MAPPERHVPLAEVRRWQRGASREAGGNRLEEGEGAVAVLDGGPGDLHLDQPAAGICGDVALASLDVIQSFSSSL